VAMSVALFILTARPFRFLKPSSFYLFIYLMHIPKTHLVKTKREHWAHTEVAILRLQCSVRMMMAKQKLARQRLMVSVDGLRILFDVIEEIVAVSLDNAELQIRRITKATLIQACWRGRKGRLKAQDRVSLEKSTVLFYRSLSCSQS
jgi:hypothetical protein